MPFLIHSLLFSVFSPYLANTDDSDHGAGSSKPKKRNLRSSGSFLPAGPTPGRSNVLPKLCIICKKRDRWLSKKGGTRKTVLDKLALCQTLTAGRLLEAAKIKNDETILPQIEGKDLVAIEVRYHQSCYKKYVNFLTFPAKQSPTVLSHYNRAYHVFCDEVVKKRLLQKKEMMMMTKLRQKFAKYVKAVEGVQCSSSYRTSNLKARLKNSFPQLVFQPAQSRSKSDIVYCETIGWEI